MLNEYLYLFVFINYTHTVVQDTIRAAVDTSYFQDVLFKCNAKDSCV